MRNYRTWREFLITRLAAREKAVGYLQAILEDYQIFGDARVVLLALQTITKA